MGTSVVSIAELREQIRQIEGVPVQTRRVATGVGAIDRLIGGLPEPGLVEIHGPPGAGRTRVALALAARHTERQRLVAWVDLDRVLYPPSAAEQGVDLRHLLIVRPSADRAVWAAEQLLRSGCFPLVVVSGGGNGLNARSAGQRWSLAAEAGGCTGLVLRESPGRGLPAAVRLAVASEELVVVRDRSGAVGGATPVPPWPSAADPFGVPPLAWAAG